MPLSADVLFFLTVGNRIPSVFANLQGVLNASGRAAGTITLPKLPVIVGLDFHMAFVTIDAVKPLGVRTVSSGRTFRIQS